MMHRNFEIPKVAKSGGSVVYTAGILALKSKEPIQQLALIEQVFIEAVSAGNDDLAVGALKDLLTLHVQIERDACNHLRGEPGYPCNWYPRAVQRFCRYAMPEYFGALPDANRHFGHFGGNKNMYREPIFLKTKLFIVGCVIEHMFTPEITEESLEALAFIARAHGGERSNDPAHFSQMFDKSEEEFIKEDKKRQHFVSREERDGIENAMRVRLDHHYFTVALVEEWLKRKEWIPKELKIILVIARARKGGPELALKDIGSGAGSAKQ